MRDDRIRRSLMFFPPVPPLLANAWAQGNGKAQQHKATHSLFMGSGSKCRQGSCQACQGNGQAQGQSTGSGVQSLFLLLLSPTAMQACRPQVCVYATQPHSKQCGNKHIRTDTHTTHTTTKGYVSVPRMFLLHSHTHARHKGTCVITYTYKAKILSFLPLLKYMLSTHLFLNENGSHCGWRQRDI